ncbi:MAG: non-ribosomal peptide synthetase, partial [bacterium]|nr:non-ribosomal peptide synthetase [bacterium]
RIELGEIELALAEHPGIRDAVVVARREAADAAGLADQRLVAYLVTPAEMPAESELRVFLGRKLADYMVPSAFVALEALPLTPSGKVDRGTLSRRELPASAFPRRGTNGGLGGREQAERLVAPRDQVEEMLAGIWTQVLGPEKALAQLGVHDNFFSLGGHSLLATRVLSRIRTAFGVELPLSGLFEAPTVAELAARVREAMRAGGELPVPAIERVPRDRELPLSFAQERLWFLDRYQPDSPIYNL